MEQPAPKRARKLSALVALLIAWSAATSVVAQQTGGSFGGSDFGGGGGSDFGGGGGGGGSSFGGGGSSAFGAPSSPSGPSAAEQARQAQEAEAQRQAAEARRAAEEAARRAAEEHARLLALPPAERVRAGTWTDDDTRTSAGSVATAWTPPPSRRERAIARWAITGRAPDARSTAPGPARGPPSTFAGVFSGGFCFLLVLFGTVWLGLFADRLRMRRPAAQPAPAAEVRRVSLALDWTARREIQRELTALARQAQTGSRGGLHAALEATRALLERHAASVRYVGWQRSAERGSSGAEAAFRRLTTGFRARFRVDVVRNAATTAAPEMRARADEGEGLVVVSIIVATATPLGSLPTAIGPAAVTQALGSLAVWSARDLWALEVIWSPAAENDRLSSAELEVLYPELARTDGGADVGRVGCAYCEAPFPAELGRCPACGAPRA